MPQEELTERRPHQSENTENTFNPDMVTVSGNGNKKSSGDNNKTTVSHEKKPNNATPHSSSIASALGTTTLALSSETKSIENLPVAASEVSEVKPSSGTCGSVIFERNAEKEVFPFQRLPKGVQIKIVNSLGLKSLSAFAITCKDARDIVEYNYMGCKIWFSRSSTKNQRLFQNIAKLIEDDDLRVWVRQFSDDEEVVADLLDKREAAYFPAYLSYTISKLMAACPVFKVVEKASSSHSSLAAYGSDGGHMVTVHNKNTAKIFSISNDWTWKEEAIIPLGQRVISSATLSLNSRHVVILSTDGMAKIYGINADREWVEEAIISHSVLAVRSATFSSDSCRVVTVSNDGMAKIYGINPERKWMEEAIISHNDEVISAIFSSDSCHVLTGSFDNTAKIYSINAEREWMEEAITSHGNVGVYLAIFSPDSSRVVTVLRDYTAKIYEISDNGTWVNIESILHYDRVLSATFSPDSHHVVVFTRSEDDMDKIYSIYNDGRRVKKKSIVRCGYSECVTFSPDSSHVFTVSEYTIGKFRDSYYAYIFQINSLCEGIWIKKIEIFSLHEVDLVTFSSNSRHVVITDGDNKNMVKIYSICEGEWMEKGKISNGGRIKSLKFSPDDCNVVTISSDKTAKIYSSNDEGEWVEKTIISHGESCLSAFFCRYGRHVITLSYNPTSYDVTIKVLRLQKPDVELSSDEPAQSEEN